ncbi:MAG TPA: DHH family phosphoesterase [Clostridiales bacterium]|nr:DHH family phosphoesterase [Clostridiales bacterium]
MKKNHNIAELKQIIDRCDNLLVISHILPDGDNIGSVIAMMQMLRAKGKQVTAVINGTLPPYYAFLSGVEALVAPEQLEKAAYDAVLCLDMSDRDRGGEVWRKIKGTPLLINIDHHISNDYFGDYNYVKAEASSTAEIVTSLFVAWQEPLTKEIAEALYTGMVTDSGSFTYPSTSPQTMAMAAVLLEQNPDLEAIRENVLENVSFKRKKVLAAVLQDAVLAENGLFCYGAIDYEQIKALDAEGPDFENIIDHLIGVIGVKYAVFFRAPEADVVKIGFRARGGLDATVVAAEFGGGGHKAAAGCSVSGSLTQVKAAVLAAVHRYLGD